MIPPTSASPAARLEELWKRIGVVLGGEAPLHSRIAEAAVIATGAREATLYLRERDAETPGSLHAQQGTRSDTASADQSGASSPLRKSEQDALFQDFLRWRKQRGEKP